MGELGRQRINMDETAEKILSKLQSEPNQWALILGNGYNHHATRNGNCSWNDILYRMCEAQLGTDVKKIYRQDGSGKPTLSEGINETTIFSIMSIGSQSQNLEKAESKFIKEVNRSIPNKEFMEKLRQKLDNLHIPIMTTNFDHLLDNDELYHSTILDVWNVKAQKLITPHIRFYEFYPWNVYYSSHSLTDPFNDSSIWHIHGEVNYPKSIRLGSIEYSGAITRSYNFIHHNGMYGKKLSEAGLTEEWRGYNTWLRIFFQKKLCIIGLSLEETETFLRYLLIERKKYRDTSHLADNDIFVCQQDAMSDGKRYFLNKIGFSIFSYSCHATFWDSLVLM